MIRSIFISFVFSTMLFAEFESDLQLKLILSEPGDTIYLESGLFQILGTLSMEGKENIVIKLNILMFFIIILVFFENLIQ